MTWTVSDVMSKDAGAIEHAAELVACSVATTIACTSLATAASLMFQHRIHELPVVDREHRPVGIISRAQLLKMFLRSDELIRGEIVRILHDAALLRSSRRDVEVTGGLVTLRCEVATHQLPRPVMERIAGVPGVFGVKLEPAVSERRAGASANRVRA